MKNAISLILSVCLGLFLADGIVSLLDDTLIVFFGIHVLAALRTLVCLSAISVALLVYVLMALTPAIPKRLFLPVTLFTPLAMLAILPIVIFWYGHLEQAAWIFSLCQVALGLFVLFRVAGGPPFRWPLVGPKILGERRFSWLNLSGFLLVNVFVLAPAVLLYFAFCASLTVNHYTKGFLVLRPSGFKVQVRKYVRPDGKTIQLIPMAHVGEAEFYRQISQTFPSNSIILMEGVTDNKNLLTNGVSYKRMASSLGLSEQEEEFEPIHGEMVIADLDVDEFSPGTIDFLNWTMLIHSKGLTPEILLQILQSPPPPEQLFDDILRKRNRHLLKQIQAHLEDSSNLMVPWGVAHMPEIEESLQKSGFRLVETHDFQVIRFGKSRPRSKAPIGPR